MPTKKEKKLRDAEYARRYKEYKSIQSQLHSAYDAFDYVTDPNMMDACIYEINALKSRYNCAVINMRNLDQ